MKSRKTLLAMVLACGAMAVAISVQAQSDFTGSVFARPGLAGLYSASQTGSSTSGNFTWSDAGCGSACLGISASGAGHLTNGLLGASVTATFPASLPISASTGFGAFTSSQYQDSLTITNGTGTGVLALTYTVVGNVTSAAGASNVVYAGVSSSDAGGTVTTSPGGNVFIYAQSASTNVYEGGFAFASGAGVSANIVIGIPFTYGTPFSIEPGLQPDIEINATTPLPSSSSLNFNDTMMLDSALVYAGTPTVLGPENASADITATSGLIYSSAGVAAPAPEIDPASAFSGFTLLGGALMVVRSRRRVRFAV